jgi:hypothetical protein
MEQRTFLTIQGLELQPVPTVPIPAPGLAWVVSLNVAVA